MPGDGSPGSPLKCSFGQRKRAEHPSRHARGVPLSVSCRMLRPTGVTAYAKELRTVCLPAAEVLHVQRANKMLREDL